MMTNKGRLFFWILILCIYLAAWIIQANLFLNWDVSYFLSATKLLLAGGSYTKNFFTPNPPMILFLSIPPVLANELFNSNLILAFRVYMFLLVSLSLALSFFLMRGIFREENAIAAYILTTILAVLFLIFPVYEFGQREHLLVILTMPYLLLVIYRLRTTVGLLQLGIFIGFLAAMGFVLKPYFLVTFVLVECYFATVKRKWFAWVRPEVLVMMAVIVTYILSIFLFYPDYIYSVLPFVMRHYSLGVVGFPWAMIVVNPFICFCWAAILFALLQGKESPFNRMNAIFIIAFLGFFCSYIMQRTLAYYHLLPAFIMATFAVAAAYLSLILKSTLTKKDYFSIALSSLLFLAFIIFNHRFFMALFVFSPLTVFFFISGIFIMALLSKNIKKLASYVALSLLGIMLFIFPLGLLQFYYWEGLVYKQSVLDRLVAFMQTQKPHSSIAVFSTIGSFGAPLIDYSGSHLAQRFDCFWPLRAFVKKPSLKDEALWINLIVDDLHEGRPDLVFVDRLEKTIVYVDANQKKMGLAFNYINYFSRNARFREEWKSYHYLTTVEYLPDYKLDVYRRG